MSAFSIALATHDPLPQGQLAQVCHHEYRELRRHRSLALSFLPSRQDISMVMALFGIESEQRLLELHRLAERMQAFVDAWEHEPQRSGAPRDAFREQVFVCDDDTARVLLARAHADTSLSLHFYESQLAICCTLEMRTLLERFRKQYRAAQRIIEELAA
ncbi:hypothetical protein F0A17_17810 [Billgrantia pellis]|uniref:Uncharacterized protein n=1 Tax=Billgrantia pellis TaxID=2606936 RepID=A0A7V7KF93_9GAMM|nr:hypothetical protein [Halomonas pellis]KAA0010322.1 hypothetical protein F0A17_17810 [Halomonas pellis]